jgi:hypothetical protein
VWRRLRRALARFFRSAPEDPHRELRTANARARFWSEVRDGEKEAESASLPDRSATTSAGTARRPQEN